MTWYARITKNTFSTTYKLGEAGSEKEAKKLLCENLSVKKLPGKVDIREIEEVKSFSDFLIIVESLKITTSHYVPGWRSCVLNDYILISWELGGYEKSVEDVSEFKNIEIYRPCGGEPEKEFLDLLKIIEKFVPEITFIQYKLLCAELTETSTQTDDWGTITACKQVSLRALYNYLVSRDWVKGRKVKIT